MTQADLERRVHQLEQKITLLERNIVVLSTGVALARWFVPVIVSVGAILVIFVK